MMYLQLHNKSMFYKLHLRTCLKDWDMEEEMKLATTTDQYFQDEKLNDHCLMRWQYARFSRQTSASRDDRAVHPFLENDESKIHPSLWLMVDPKQACSIRYPKLEEPQPKAYVKSVCVTNIMETSPNQYISNMDDSYTDLSPSSSSSSELMVTEDDDTSSIDIPVRKVRTTSKRRAPRQTAVKRTKTHTRRFNRRLQHKDVQSHGWPRPPINYCVLIALALRNSNSGSLNVQQIYNFIREHFPFFRTAPDGWKNTIRHNLCFSQSFKKATNDSAGKGRRKSCLWRLTLEGEMKLQDETGTLSEEVLRVLRRSINKPELMEVMFDL
ncbi:forkhead box protein R1 [Protopterus annectens]|uniref:forkhead box protein R1 n=1 Tax=Protopterus annectens TaxID=7888 RepID=UPI001CFBFD75|nr:forkhead box protein R1 [Protopterus annectens]